MAEPLVEVKGLKKYFPTQKVWRQKKSFVRAVDGVDLAIYRGEVLGLVGESGCGKTTVGRLILKLTEPTEGEIFFEGKNITHLDQKEIHPLRRYFQIIFQDPFASLNPRMTVAEIVGRPLEIHGLIEPSQRDERVGQILESVGLPREHLYRYPHEFSGGQRKRIGIARALATQPKLIVADEPTSALDVSVQAQILNLMKELQKAFGLTYLFVSHNIGVIRHMSDRVAVMYLGKLVEIGKKRELFASPLHPYTKALLAAVPSLNPKTKREEIILEGDVPSPINPPAGCRFHPRCKYVLPKCSREEPIFHWQGDERWIACHLYQ